MNKQKQNYVAPEAQTLVVGFEGMVCSSTNQVLGIIYSDTINAAGASFSSDAITSYGDDF